MTGRLAYDLIEISQHRKRQVSGSIFIHDSHQAKVQACLAGHLRFSVMKSLKKPSSQPIRSPSRKSLGYDVLRMKVCEVIQAGGSAFYTP